MDGRTDGRIRLVAIPINNSGTSLTSIIQQPVSSPLPGRPTTTVSYTTCGGKTKENANFLLGEFAFLENFGNAFRKGWRSLVKLAKDWISSGYKSIGVRRSFVFPQIHWRKKMLDHCRLASCQEGRHVAEKRCSVTGPLSVLLCPR